MLDHSTIKYQDLDLSQCIEVGRVLTEVWEYVDEHIQTVVDEMLKQIELRYNEINDTDADFDCQMSNHVLEIRHINIPPKSLKEEVKRITLGLYPELSE